MSGLADGALFIQASATNSLGDSGHHQSSDPQGHHGWLINFPITADNLINEAEATSGYTFTGKAEAGATITGRVEDALGHVFTPDFTITADSTGAWSAFIDISSIENGEATVYTLAAQNSDPA